MPPPSDIMDTLFEKIRSACDRPLSQSTTLPREAYRCEDSTNGSGMNC